MLRLSGYGLQIRLSGLLQINRECENYAKRCSHGDRGTWVWVPVPQR